MGVATLSSHGVNPEVDGKLPHDLAKNFVPVTELVKAAGVLVINAQLPTHTFEEFVKCVKTIPVKVTFASPASGTIGHMWGELFKSATTTTFMLHLP